MRISLVVLRIVVRFPTVARDFSSSIRLDGHWESPGLQFQRVPGFFQGFKTAGAWCWSIPFTSEVNNEWLYIPIPPYTSTECSGTPLLYDFRGFRSGTTENSVLLESDAAPTHYLLKAASHSRRTESSALFYLLNGHKLVPVSSMKHVTIIRRS
jgi:hypothetical protein